VPRAAYLEHVEQIADPALKPDLDALPETVFEVHTHGGRTPTGLEAVTWAKRVVELGAGEIVLTSMDADGTKDGYDVELTRAIVEATEVPVVASGGCGRPQHMIDALRAIDEGGAGASAALAASIFHYNEYTIAETKRALAAAGVPVRIMQQEQAA
jgi:cyclase